MKKRVLLATVAVGALLFGTAAPASAATGAAASGTIVDVAVAASGGGTPDSNPNDYDILVQALIATNLAPVLADPNSTFTVFAPNDAAFMRTVGDVAGRAPTSEAEALTLITSKVSIEQLTQVLLYHVVAGKKLGPVAVLTAGTITTAQGGNVYPRGVTLRDENRNFQDPRLVLSALNIKASNGVIHTINRVLVPASGM